MSQWAPFYHPTHETRAFKKCMLVVNYQQAGQIIIFHLAFPWNKRCPLLNHYGGLVVWGRYNLGQADQDVTSLGQLCVAEKKYHPWLQDLGESWAKLSTWDGCLKPTCYIIGNRKNQCQPPNPPGKYDLHGFLSRTLMVNFHPEKRGLLARGLHKGYP